MNELVKEKKETDVANHQEQPDAARTDLQHFDGDIECLFEAMGITSMDVLLGIHDSDASEFFDVMKQEGLMCNVIAYIA